MYKRYQVFVANHKDSLPRWLILGVAFAAVLNLFQRNLLDAVLLVTQVASLYWQPMTGLGIALALLVLLVMACRTNRHQTKG